MTTRDKRASVLGLGLASLLVLPAPGTLDQPDRQHVAYSYRGISASAPAVVVVNTIRLTGTYLPAVALTGTYLPAVAVTGTYLPSIRVTGYGED